MTYGLTKFSVSQTPRKQEHGKLSNKRNKSGGKKSDMKSVPFSSIFSKADRALLVFTFPSISLTFVAVLKKKKANYQTQSMQTMK
jgi:hypothetical protein